MTYVHVVVISMLMSMLLIFHVLISFLLGFQVTQSNPMVGIDGRFGLLKRLGKALRAHPEYFGKELHRPGNIVDYLMPHVVDKKVCTHKTEPTVCVCVSVTCM